jgi:nanoRNase/pAp phosphatase (c-di-AMP/oligoRNAs hydrolase)
MTIDGKWVGDEPYWARLIDLLRDASLEEVMREPEVARRCQQILDSQKVLKSILLKCTTLKGNVIFTDLRGIEEIPDGNRFLLYTLFPSGNISLKITYDSQRANTTAISVGYNIFNTTSKVNVGALMEQYGGGGHKVVGSCRVPSEEADKAVDEILEAIKE